MKRCEVIGRFAALSGRGPGFVLAGALALAAGMAGRDARAEATLTALGGSGLVTIPDARALPVETLAPSLGGEQGRYRHASLTWQPLEGTQLVLRRSYRPGSAADARPLENGGEIRQRLWGEGPWWPALAVGLRDPLGGRQASEYLVAGRRWWDWDFTLGLGWGRLGEAGGLGNPLGMLGRRYHRPRPPLGAPDGPGAWFSGGSVGVFGGVSWSTPLPGVTLHLELPGERLRAERGEQPSLGASLPLNAALSWHPWPELEVGAGIMGGERIMLRVALPLNPGQWTPPHAIAPPPGASLVSDGVRATVRLEQSAAGADLHPPVPAMLGAARAVAARLPPGVAEVRVLTSSYGVDGAAVAMVAQDLRNAGSLAGSPNGSIEEVRANARFLAATEARADLHDQEDLLPWPRPVVWNAVVPRLMLDPFNPAATPWRLSLDSTIAARLLEDWVTGLVAGGGVRLHLADGLQAGEAGQPPRPRHPVRSDLADHLHAQPLRTEHAHLSWLAAPDAAVRTRISAGWMDELFAGVASEILWRPGPARWAMGAEAAQVWKRRAGTPFQVEPYAPPLVTALANLFWDSPDDRTTFALHTGRFLAGDAGAAVDITRRLDNGIRLGAQFSGTTGFRDGYDYGGFRVSEPARQRLALGFTLTVPLGALSWLPASSRGEVSFIPLARDTAQRLAAPLPLHETFRGSAQGVMMGRW